MSINAIDSGRIQAMMAQLKAAAQPPDSKSVAIGNPLMGGVANATGLSSAPQSKKVDFADALKSSLNQRYWLERRKQTRINTDNKSRIQIHQGLYEGRTAATRRRGIGAVEKLKYTWLIES